MKNVKILSAVIMSTCVLFGCGEKNTLQSSSQETIDTSAQSKTISTGTNMSNIPDIMETTTESDSDSDYFNWDYLNFYLPSWLHYEDMYGYYVFSGNLTTNDKIYYHFASSGYYDSSRPDYIQDYNYKNAPEIIGYSLDKVVFEFYPYFEDKYSVTVDTEETVECNGYPFLRRTGVIHTEKYADQGEIADLDYVAYYGCMDMEMFDGRSVPMMWAAFSEVTDENTKVDMEMLVDTAARDAEWIVN